MIFQQYALFPWLTVRKNVEFGLRLTNLPAAARKRRVDHAIGLVGLTDFADALPKTLSGGMKQRCVIARAYAVDPAVLLMDEPFGALDALTRVQLQDQLLHTWSQERRTVLFVTHDVDEAVYLARRVVVMAARPGRIHTVVDVDLPYPRTEEIRLSAELRRRRSRTPRLIAASELTAEITSTAAKIGCGSDPGTRPTAARRARRRCPIPRPSPPRTAGSRATR